MSSKEAFLSTVRQALGKKVTSQPESDKAMAFYDEPAEVQSLVNKVMEQIKTQETSLVDGLEERASRAGWEVARVESKEAAAEAIAKIITNAGAQNIFRSDHEIFRDKAFSEGLNRLGLNPDLAILDNLESGKDNLTQRQELRKKLETADIGITGVDYAVAETGSCVQFSSGTVSRLLSLLPPIYIAIVRRDQILPSLDELFLIRRRDYHEKKFESSMTLISGPSRSADIENVLVTGVHGPGEVHMIILD